MNSNFEILKHSQSRKHPDDLVATSTSMPQNDFIYKTEQDYSSVCNSLSHMCGFCQKPVKSFWPLLLSVQRPNSRQLMLCHLSVCIMQTHVPSLFTFEQLYKKCSCSLSLCPSAKYTAFSLQPAQAKVYITPSSKQRSSIGVRQHEDEVKWSTAGLTVVC